MNSEKIVWDKRDGSQRILDKSDICPISKKWLIPANCTEEEPPKINEGDVLYFQNGKWIIEETKKQTENEVKFQSSSIISLQDQIQELKAEIEQLKFEKNEIKLDMRLEKERLFDDIENAKADIEKTKLEKEKLLNDIENVKVDIEQLKFEKEEIKNVNKDILEK